MVLSTESLSSGYGSDSFLPVSTETMDTEDYELWERRQVGLHHRLNLELDLQRLLGSMSRDVHNCTHWLRPGNPPSPRIWTRIYEGAIGQPR
jgi:hypothetical protein